MTASRAYRPRLRSVAIHGRTDGPGRDVLLITILMVAFALLLAFAPARPATAQVQGAEAAQPAMLVADDVRLSGENRLEAHGNVEAYFQGQRLRATSITYDRATDRLEITGPITLTDGGYTTVLADSASLDRDMQNGLLRGARMVMDERLQVAGAQLNREDGRLSQLYNATVTSCRVCEHGRPPLWQIRAKRVVHDSQARQLYLHNAQFQVLDVPVFYLPRLRLPDPTVERASGFLVPVIRTSSLLGTGVKVPYFLRLGDHADITLTPYVSEKTRTLEFRYRQAFSNGDLRLDGAISDDDLTNRDTRGYLFGEGRFDIGNDFKLNFDVELTSDDAYLVDYGYSGKDRLESQIELERTNRNTWLRGAVTGFHSIRDGEQNSTLPTIVGDVAYERRIFPERAGGEVRLTAEAHSHFRSSDLAVDGPDFDTFADGRDVTRLTTAADWRRSWTLAGGLRGTVMTGLAIDHFEIRQAGVTSAGSATELTPSTAVQLRWPLIRTGTGGVTHVVEPVAQLAWVGGSDPFVPNDESTRNEFDEGNLFSLSRFTETDRRERGASAAYGVTWTRTDPQGWHGNLTLGQVVREERQTEPGGGFSFTQTSGLRGDYSDLLVSGQVHMPSGLSLFARGIFDPELDTEKAEARAFWYTDKTQFGASYIWLGDDPAENRTGTLSEWAFNGSYRFTRHWTGSAQWRYDIANDESVTAGAGVTYTNECVEVSLSALRRFTSSTVLEPSTDISLTVGLRGFSTRTQDKSYVRTCK